MEHQVTDNVRATVLMVGSMALFAIEDMLIKLASSAIGPGQAILILSVIGLAGFAVVARRRRMPLFGTFMLEPALLIRNAGEIIGTISFVTALGLISLSVQTAIFQATPLAVVLGAALFLKEPVGWRRWSAIIVGFIGVILVIRPGAEGFEPASLLVIITVFALAARDLATRRIKANLSSVQIAFSAYLSLLAPAILLVVFREGWQPMDARAASYIILAGSIGVVGYLMVTLATRIGESSAIAPFRYSRLVFGTMAGMIMFGETITAWTLIGAALIIGSGIFTFYRERRLSRKPV